MSVHLPPSGPDPDTSNSIPANQKQQSILMVKGHPFHILYQKDKSAKLGLFAKFRCWLISFFATQINDANKVYYLAKKDFKNYSIKKLSPEQTTNTTSAVDQAVQQKILDHFLEEWQESAPRNLKQPYANAANAISRAYKNKKIKMLVLKDYPLKTLPACIGMLDHLTSLTIDGRHLSSESSSIPSEIANLKNLRTMRLYDCGARTTLPKNLYSLPTSCKLIIHEVTPSLNASITSHTLNSDYKGPEEIERYLNFKKLP